MSVAAPAGASLELPGWVLHRGLPVLVILAVAAVVSAVARFAVRRMQRRIEGAGAEGERHLLRAATLTHALSSALQAAIWTVAALLALGEAGVNLGPLLAGAGIAGVALGFGAQSLVRDFLSGFFILLEDQFAVGDRVDLAAAGGVVTGTVETLSLRTTSVRGDDGTLHVVPNGNIQLVGNRSRGGARAGHRRKPRDESDDEG